MRLRLLSIGVLLGVVLAPAEAHRSRRPQPIRVESAQRAEPEGAAGDVVSGGGPQPRGSQVLAPSPSSRATQQFAGLGTQDNVGLRVLYAGDADTERTKSWLGFLAARTAGSRFADREKLTAADLEGVDAVVFDGDLDRFLSRRRPGERPAFPEYGLLLGVPTVLIGGVGSALGSQFQLKTSSWFG